MTHLRELLGKATKGPWYIHPLSSEVSIGIKNRHSYSDRICDFPQWSNAKGHGSREEQLANAALIVEAVNKLPRLLDALDEAKKAIELVRACVMDGAPQGFNPLVGDWAMRLYESQADTLEALATIEKVMK